jgi:hypothetical protein
MNAIADEIAAIILDRGTASGELADRVRAVAWSRTLAGNLEIAGALHRAHALGHQACTCDQGPCGNEWHPGCGYAPEEITDRRWDDDYHEFTPDARVHGACAACGNDIEYYLHRACATCAGAGGHAESSVASGWDECTACDGYGFTPDEGSETE